MNSKQIKEQVLSQIKQHKLQCEAVADAHFKKAFLNAGFKKEYAELKQLEFNKAKLEFNKKDTSDIAKKILSKEETINKILKTLNLSVKDFEPQYNCKLCNDTGIVDNKYCSCFYKNYNEALIENLGVRINRTHTFQNADYTLFNNPKETKKLYLKIFNWCKDIKNSKVKTMLLVGDTGVGKTYLTECICNEIINKNIVVNYYTSFALNDLFYKYHTSFSENRVGLLDGVMNCDVLIIDDFGSEPKIKTTEEYFYALINERSIKKLTTIISTNLSPMQIMDKYGERTFSRLNNKQSSVLFKMNNDDLRIKLKQKQDK